MKLAALAAVLALSIAAPAATQTYADSDWRTPDPNNILVVETNRGRIVIELEPRVAPGHVERVRALARKGFYNGLGFFRVIDNFMAQTGDPQNDGRGGSDLPDLKAEFEFRRGPTDPFVLYQPLPAGGGAGVTEVGFLGVMPVRTGPQMQMMVSADGKTFGFGMFCPGVLGMARASEPNSANSQFFLMRQGNPALNSEYTAFGRVISGLEVVRSIKAGPEDDNGKVVPPFDTMTRVRVLADIPAAERPRVQVMDTKSPGFQAFLAAEKAKRGGIMTVCEVEIPAIVG